MAQASIFLSYRSEDQAVAEAIKRGIQDLAQGKVEIHLAAQMLGGAEWRKWIESSITKSSGLLFLYTDKHADWKWCMYEIGMFRGIQGIRASGVPPNAEGERLTGIACIMDADIPEDELPPQLRDLQVYRATEAGILKLFEELLYRGAFTDKKPLRDIPPDRAERQRLDQQMNNIVEQTVRSFRHRTTFFCYRLEFSLCNRSDVEPELLPSDEWTVSGTREALDILGMRGQTERWSRLYQRLKAEGTDSVAWLDDLRREIREIESRQDDTIDNPVLRPFQSNAGRVHIPVVSRTETFRKRHPGPSVSPGEDGLRVIPSKVFVILVPVDERLMGFRNLGDFFARETCTVYPPTSVVRVRWRRKSSADKYAPDDMDGVPVISAGNPKFRQLFNHTGSVPDPNGPFAWTVRALLARVKDFVDDEVMQRLEDDQKRVTENILLLEGDDRASAPLQILSRPKAGGEQVHPNFAGRSFLPHLLAKQRVGNVAGPHEQYLLVSYIEV